MNPYLRRGLWVAAGLVLLSGLLLPRWLSSRAGDAERPSAGAAAPVPVGVITLRPQPIAETLTTTGTLFADERIEVVSEVAGKVREIHFREGSSVAAGALLVQIDDRELRAEHDRLAARLELADRRRQRQLQLFDQGLISDEDLDSATTEADALRAELRLNEVRLAKTQIRAPFAGTVGLRSISEGAYVSPQTVVTTLLDSRVAKLDFAVPERYAGEFRPGREVRFRVAGFEASRAATVYAVEPSVDLATRTVSIRARSPNPDGDLLPGSFADVLLTLRENTAALAVPAIAVLPEQGGRRVYVVEDGLAVARAVTTGVRTESQVEVTSGLALGDEVIVSGLQMVRPGAAVRVVQRDTEQPAP